MAIPALGFQQGTVAGKNKSCPICTVDLKKGRKAIVHLGGEKHPFCNPEELLQWVIQKGSCPCCRAKVDADSLISLLSTKEKVHFFIQHSPALSNARSAGLLLAGLNGLEIGVEWGLKSFGLDSQRLCRIAASLNITDVIMNQTNVNRQIFFKMAAVLMALTVIDVVRPLFSDATFPAFAYGTLICFSNAKGISLLKEAEKSVKNRMRGSEENRDISFLAALCVKAAGVAFNTITSGAYYRISLIVEPFAASAAASLAGKGKALFGRLFLLPAWGFFTFE